jgi:putative membrane protein
MSPLVLKTNCEGRRGDGYHMAHGMGGFGMFIMVGIIILIVIAVVNLTRGAGNEVSSRVDPKSSSLAILNERYARGEIDHSEYDERKNRLA